MARPGHLRADGPHGRSETVSYCGIIAGMLTMTPIESRLVRREPTALYPVAATEAR